MRAHFFRVIKMHEIPDDLVPRFELLQALTDNGKDARYFEEEVMSNVLLFKLILITFLAGSFSIKMVTRVIGRTSK